LEKEGIRTEWGMLETLLALAAELADDVPLLVRALEHVLVGDESLEANRPAGMNTPSRDPDLNGLM
jgi:hypothetical protein